MYIIYMLYQFKLTKYVRLNYMIGYSSKGGAVGGVQGMGVVLYNKTAYNIM